MDDAEVARRMQLERGKLDVIVSDLRKAADARDTLSPEDWLARLRERFAHFRAHLNHRIALEEYGGFMAAVIEHRPTLSRDVEHLKCEHEELLRLCDEIHGELAAVEHTDANGLGDVVIRIRHALLQIKHHEEHEALLFATAFSLDIGTGD